MRLIYCLEESFFKKKKNFVLFKLPMILLTFHILFNGFAFSLQTLSRWELMGIPKNFIMVFSQWNLNISHTAF